MVIFRHHRGGLAESMATAKEFETLDDMKAYIYEYHKKFYQSLGFDNAPFELKDIVIEDKCDSDDRIGWNDVRGVCVKKYGSDDYMKEYGCAQCIGMCATDYKR